VRLEDPRTGAVGHGEAAPLPEFGSESHEEAQAFLGRAARETTLGGIDALLADAPPAAGFALWAARTGLGGRAGDLRARSAALLTLGPTSADELPGLRARGARTCKLKLGRADPSVQWEWLKAVAAALQDGERLRLDPNRSWTEAQWGFWRPRLHGLGAIVEFIEEPFAAVEDTLHCAERSPVPLALDESLARGGLAALRDSVGRGWPGFWIIKPSLLGPADAWLELLTPLAGRVVVSSALETGIGMSALIALAARFPETDHGLGTQDFFADGFGARQDGFMLAPLPPAQQEAVWNSLSGN